MGDGGGSGDLADLLEHLLTGVAVIRDGDGTPRIGIGEGVADLIDAQPVLLSPAADAELARRLASAPEPSVRERIEAARQVLAACREAGGAAPLRGSLQHAQNERVASQADDTARSLVVMLQALSQAERTFAEGGLLRSALGVVRGRLLLALADAPDIDRKAAREAALEALSQGLPELWDVQRDEELAALQEQAGVLCAERHNGDRAENLERAIACFQAALTVRTPDGTPHDWAMTQNNLGAAYGNRLRGDPVENQEQAIAHYQAALMVYTPDGTPHNWAWTQNNLGAAYYQRLRGNRGENQERAIVCFEAALTVRTPNGTPQLWAETQNDLGTTYNARLRGNRGENQERAIACFEAALTVYTLDDTPHGWARTQSNLGVAYGDRLRGNRGENQERAIAYFQAALTVFTAERVPQDWVKAQTNLGAVYNERPLGDYSENQERAIACFLAALTVCTPDGMPHEWARTQNNLGKSYRRRLRGDRIENQELAIAYFQAALTVRTKSGMPYEWAMTKNNLGAAYHERLRGDRGENQERSIACYQAVMTVYTADDTPYDWAKTQNNLGVVYNFRLRGENQEWAIACYHAALTVFTPDGTPHDWAGTQSNLGNTYKMRLHGDRGENLERAIACCQAALTVYTPDDTPHDWANTQNNLGAVYYVRLRGDRGENLEQAIASYQLALTVYTPDDTPHDWAMIQSNLGVAYSDRLHGDLNENLERAIACFHAALTVHTAEGSPHDWASTQNNLGIVYSKLLCGERGENLERAIACYQAALTVRNPDATPHGWASTQNNLGVVYGDRLRGDRAENLERAVECYQAAVPLLRLSDPPGALRALAAIGGLHRELHRPIDTCAAWQEAMALRETLLSAGTSAETRGDAVQHNRNLLAHLVLLETELGDPVSAVATLERGRAIALRTALALDDIWFEGLDPGLREPIAQARGELETLRALPPSATDGQQPGAVTDWDARVLAAQAALTAALEAAQAANGFNPPPPLDAVALAALAPPGGAMVLLATAPEGGVAFILPHASGAGDGRIEPVQLPGATTTALREMLIEWYTAYGTLLARFRADGSVLGEPLLNANKVLEVMLDGLWRQVMGPVLAALPNVGLGPGAPLVLLPQGDLALMPLHAAGPARSGGAWRCVLDDHEVRYAPGGYALQTAKQRLERRQSVGTIDAAGRGRDLFGAFNPMKGDKDRALPWAEDIEMPALRALFEQLGHTACCCLGQEASGQPANGAGDVTLPWASVEQVKVGTPSAGYVHFACHARFDMETPDASGLQLAGGEYLTVPMIVRDLRLQHCRLITLSACETAMVDVLHLPDEFVGLPAAFLQAGAPGVVATFWTVLDQPTAAMIARFYALHLEGGLPPATALRQAVLDLRNAGAEASAEDRPRHASVGEAPESEVSESAVPISSKLRPDVPPELQRLFAMPIVWAAYAHHGV